MKIKNCLCLFCGVLCIGLGISLPKGFADTIQSHEVTRNAHDPDKLRGKAIRGKTIHKEIYSPTKPGTGNDQSKPDESPVYKPPFLGAPSANRLVGMAVRGINHKDLLLSVLTPEHTGLTSRPQPDLYWYLSRSDVQSYKFIEMVLISETSIMPVLRTQLQSPVKPGLQKISLADYNISLLPDTEYTWSIALVTDPDSRSLDIVSSGKIKFKKSEPVLQTRLSQSETSQYAFVYAAAGLWYETVSSLVEQLNTQPHNQAVTHNLAALLEQAGLEEIVTHLHTDPE
ncbi:MAG TPA: DUF928 domain-containing protein [Crenotrichaceae bacterium]|nr:DUF928 domain-containing protein [Crenotrichaceae bacterium]